jgi:hypothetical protein
MRTILFAVLVIIFCLETAGQMTSDTLIPGDMFFRFNPTTLIDLSETNISVGFERKMSDHISIALDGGYIFYSDRFHTQGRCSGFIIRPAIRYFPVHSKVFAEVEFHYKQHIHYINDWLGHDAVEGIPAYEEYSKFRMRKQVTGIHVKAGRLIPVTHRLWIELYLGIGIHFRKYTIIDEPHSVYSFNQDFTDVTTGQKERLIAMPAGGRLLYRFR